MSKILLVEDNPDAVNLLKSQAPIERKFAGGKRA